MILHEQLYKMKIAYIPELCEMKYDSISFFPLKLD